MSVGVDHIDVQVKSGGILIRNALDAAIAREGRVLMESGKWENSSLWLLGQDINIVRGRDCPPQSSDNQEQIFGKIVVTLAVFFSVNDITFLLFINLELL